jgi:hypothetical protein
MSATNEPAKILVHGLGRCAQMGFRTHTTPVERAQLTDAVMHDAVVASLLDGYFGIPFQPEPETLSIRNLLLRVYQQGARWASHS